MTIERGVDQRVYDLAVELAEAVADDLHVQIPPEAVNVLAARLQGVFEDWAEDQETVKGGRV